MPTTKERRIAISDHAQAYYEYSVAVLETFNGPGGSPRYEDPIQAREMRRLYQRAYQTVYARSDKGRENSRKRDRRRGGQPRKRSGSALRFYKELISANEVVCHYCRQVVPLYARVGDHYIPFALGGEHTYENLVAACRDCNSLKGNTHPDEFAKR